MINPSEIYVHGGDVFIGSVVPDILKMWSSIKILVDRFFGHTLGLITLYVAENSWSNRSYLFNDVLLAG